MNKRWLTTGAALMAAALLLCAPCAAGEERKLGDYVYVPATAQAQSGRIFLRVEGQALDGEDGQEPLSLEGCVFEVYVISGEGELRRWANPLYPSEAMAVRTGGQGVSFTLPEGMEFYLRQQSAPEGYVFDSEALIPVAGDEIVVRNAMAGELRLRAVDTLGAPVEGVELTVQLADGSAVTLMTDANGEAVLTGESATAEGVLVSETALPQGVYAPLGATVDSVAADGAPVQVSAQIIPAHRTQIVFEHPASGSVQLCMSAQGVGEDGGLKSRALAQVRMDVEGGGQSLSVVTDEQGVAEAALLEGTYDIRFAYEGGEDVILPVEAGQLVVRSGYATVIELAAKETTGRIVVQAEAAQVSGGGSVTIQSELTGESVGTFALDADGMAVSSPLAPGEYRIADMETPEGTVLGSLSFGDMQSEQTDGLSISVSAGEASFVRAQLLTRERERFELVARRLGDDGEDVQARIDSAAELELVGEDGAVEAELSAEGGYVQVEALSGAYTLRMDGRLAAELGVQAESEPFELPAQGAAVVFADRGARLRLVGVDTDGAPAAGAVYAVTDSAGRTVQAVCDESGEAVTERIAAGEATVVTVTAPENHDAAQPVTVQASAGETVRVEIAHERYARVTFDVRLERLDEQGETVSDAIEGARVRLYRVGADGQSMSDTRTELVSGADGRAELPLEAGEYVAQLDGQSLPAGCRAGDALRLQITNGEDVQAQLLALDALGGVRVRVTGGEVSDELLAQTRFELVASDGTATDLTMREGGFYAGGLAAGVYLLRQTQIPEGYTLAAERTVSVSGAQVALAEIPLEEYAVLSVAKTGLTFNDRLQTYLVPLAGEYGVYVREGDAMKAYPSESAQATVWSGVTPEQAQREGKNASVKLPASEEGAVYYLRELGSAAGFARDEEYHEITLHAGERATLSCAVSSDRGFFELEMTDAQSGAQVAGGSFALIDRESGESVLTFDMDAGAYRNEMAVPVGAYLLRQTQAAPGYALSDVPEQEIVIEPYLTQGGSMTAVRMRCAALPEGESVQAIDGFYAAREQDMTLVSVDALRPQAGTALLTPSLTISLAGDNGQRLNVSSVVLGGATDAAGRAYMARVEYALAGGGWQPSDARMTGVLSGPAAVSLADVEDDVCAVRVTWLDAQTGEEIAAEGFAAGQTALCVRVGAQGETQVSAQAVFEGRMASRTEWGGEETVAALRDERTVTFTAEDDGLFETISAGRDGRISGVAFFDENADGVLSAGEKNRYAGLNVRLLSASGDVLDTCRTGADGAYRFEGLSSGTYCVAFDGGEDVVFSSSERYSAQVTSGVRDARYGESAPVTIDGDHSDYVIHAGCIYAARVEGFVLESGAAGYAGLNVELHCADTAGAEEPTVVTTDEQGRYAFAGVLPGEYTLSMDVPAGYLCEQAEDGAVTQRVTAAQGDELVMGDVTLSREASIGGRVRIDDDGDGLMDDTAEPLSGVKVTLLRVRDGHSEAMQTAVTDERGAYRFDGLYAGEYSVLFELDGDWTFTRYGEDSLVYGAVSQSGGTKSIRVAAGQNETDVNAGVTLPAQLTVTVFCDTQLDGLKGGSEQGLEGVSVSLVRLEGGEAAESVTYRTAADGSVVFAGVGPGTYRLAYQMPGQWRATINAEGAQGAASCVPHTMLSSGESEPFTLTMGQTGVHLYIGAMLSCSISGTAYYDDDANAQRSETEEACEGVTAELIDAQGEIVARTATDADGTYAFAGLAPGRYRVQFTAQEGCAFSASERSMTRGGVQESDGPVSQTKIISVYSGDAVTTADAGVVRLCAVSGTVWEDRNGDRIRDGGEAALAGVTVHLMNGTGRSILASAQTDASGAFVFEGVRPGSYKLRVDAPEGYVFSGMAEGGALTLESADGARGYSVGFTLSGGARVENAGFGLLTQGKISGVIWTDADYDGRMGEQEAGLRGAQVELLGADGEAAAQMLTARSGAFEFEGLMPGDYALRVTLPEGYVFTAADGDSIAPRTDSPSVVLPLEALEMGGAMTELRVGALQLSSLSGVAWLDADDDGRRQNDSEGMPGVRVTLTVLSGADMGTIRETVTDDTGAYRFDGVAPGEVRLGFALAEGYAFARGASGTRRVSIVPQADALTGESEALTVISGENQTELDCGVVGVGVVSGVVWEDDAYNGRMDHSDRGVQGAQMALLDAKTGETVRETVTGGDGAYAIDFVRMGEYVLRVTLPDGMIFTCDGESAVPMSDSREGSTQSFALTMGESRENLNIGAIVPASVSGFVRIDENEDGTAEEGDDGLPDVSVTLMQGGTAVATASTDEHGAYTLRNLRPGSYRLRVTLPVDALFSENTPLRTVGSDAQEGETGTVTLSMGEDRQMDTIAAVLASSIAGIAWSDDDADGRIDAGEPGLTDVTVELLSGGEVVARTQVTEDGVYAFALLRSGRYQVRFTLPEDMLLCDQAEGRYSSSCPVVPGHVGTTDEFALSMGENRADVNVGGIYPGEIGDSVWLDVNGNGLQDYREPLLSGVRVTLLKKNAAGAFEEIAAMESDEYGYYHFRELRPGDYILRVDTADGTLTSRFGAPLGEIDSDADPATGETDALHLESGQTMLSVDFGFTEHSAAK